MKLHRLLVINFLLLYSVVNSFGQVESTAMHSKSYYEKLKIEFEIKDVMHPDSLLIEKINWDLYEIQRLNDSRVEVYDNQSGYWIILYSKIESKKNYSSKQPLQRFKLPDSKKSKNQY